MNESHYPPSPSYYRRGNADARDLVTPSYWTDSALVHLMRAGRKDGEPFADAVRNAFVCLALWFRSQSLPVPFYSAELDRLQARIRELERAEDDRGIAEAVRQMDDPAWPPNLQVNDKLRAENARLQSRIAELEAAARPVATEAGPLRDLLEAKTDDDFRAWLKMAGYDQTPDSFHGDRIIRWTMPNTVSVYWDTVMLPGKPWRISAPGVFCDKAEVAARTLHRFLTGGKP
jgi:hypothetical protein